MHVTITFEVLNRSLGDASAVLLPVRVDIDGPTTPALLDRVRAIVEHIERPGAPSDCDRIVAAIEAQGRTVEALRADVANVNALLRRYLAGGR